MLTDKQAEVLEAFNGTPIRDWTMSSTSIEYITASLQLYSLGYTQINPDIDYDECPVRIEIPTKTGIAALQDYRTKQINKGWKQFVITNQDCVDLNRMVAPQRNEQNDFNIGDRVMVEFGKGIITAIDPSYPNGMPIIVTHDDGKGRGAYRCDEIEFLDGNK